MKNIVIFSMTMWNEQPRLRHQVASLLSNAGYSIDFFQNTKFIWSKDDEYCLSKVNGNICLHRSDKLVHLQLRFGGVINWINSKIEGRSIRRRLLGKINDDTVVINFNFDYYFLRDVFPRNKILTIINDDFVAQAKFFNGIHFLNSLKNTCLMSDEVFVVSYPLARQVSQWCEPRMLFPWADVEYIPPVVSTRRNFILLWANIDYRIDFDLINYILESHEDYELHVFGNIQLADLSVLSVARSSERCKFFNPSGLDEIDLTKYFVSIIPYKLGVKDIMAVTVSNKTFQLLARGLPIVTYGMPEFLEDNAIQKSCSYDDFVEKLTYFYDHFYDVQPSIELLVARNQSASRLIELERSMLY